jgi:SAM-dependent methyltransferase
MDADESGQPEVGGQVAGVRVDDEGLTLPAALTGVLDVEIGDHRVWSFAADRFDDVGRRKRHVPWPKVLRRFLDGRARVVLREHVSQRVCFDDEVSFGSGTEEIRVEDAEGRALAVTKYGRLNRPFDGVGREAVDSYLDEVEKVLHVLQEDCHVPAFISFGTLLGAVRTGRLIGHDVDVDLGYLSAYDHPADMIRETYRVERALKARGYTVRRENGGFLALYFTQSDGAVRNLDIFACWTVGEWLHQVHDIRARLPRSVVEPIGEIELEGRTWPAPAKPEALLEAAYGPGWRVPDPAFEFSAPPSRQRRMQGWLGGMRADRDRWMGWYGRPGHRDTAEEPSTFARWVAERDSGPFVADLGCGTGGDAVWFARAGREVLAVDFVPAAVRATTEAAEAAGVPVRVENLSFCDLRHALGLGARLSRRERPLVYARGLLHELDPVARSQFWRTLEMATVGGGRAYLEFDAVNAPGADRRVRRGGRRGRAADPFTVVRTVQRRGGRVLEREDVVEDDRPRCRMVVTWER